MVLAMLSPGIWGRDLKDAQDMQPHLVDRSLRKLKRECLIKTFTHQGRKLWMDFKNQHVAETTGNLW